MDRNNGRYTYIRRQGQHQQQQQTLNSSSSSNLVDVRNSTMMPPREPLTQHDELIRYIKEAWHKVNEHGQPVVYRHEADPLKNFKPFDLEEYWGQRLVQNIHVSHGHQ